MLDTMTKYNKGLPLFGKNSLTFGYKIVRKDGNNGYSSQYMGHSMPVGKWLVAEGKMEACLYYWKSRVSPKRMIKAGFFFFTKKEDALRVLDKSVCFPKNMFVIVPVLGKNVFLQGTQYYDDIQVNVCRQLFVIPGIEYTR